jgi:hypothetical protein
MQDQENPFKHTPLKKERKNLTEDWNWIGNSIGENLSEGRFGSNNERKKKI